MRRLGEDKGRKNLGECQELVKGSGGCLYSPPAGKRTTPASAHGKPSNPSRSGPASPRVMHSKPAHILCLCIHECNPMEVKVLFFARSRELAGKSEAGVALPDGATTGGLLKVLLEQASRVVMACTGDPGLGSLLHGFCALLRKQPAGVPVHGLSPAAFNSLPMQYPALEGLGGRFVFSLNQEYLEQGADVPLKEGDELAVIPPISGG